MSWFKAITDIFRGKEPQDMYAQESQMLYLKGILQARASQTFVHEIPSPDRSLSLILEFYKEHKVTAMINIDDGDLLLFQYGTQICEGEDPQFCMNFVRQIAQFEGDEYFQIGMNLYYPIKGFETLEPFNTWSLECHNLDYWRDAVVHSKGFQIASKQRCLGYEVELTNT